MEPAGETDGAQAGAAGVSARPATRLLIRLLAVALLAAPACGRSADGTPGAARIVLVVVDTLRADHLGAYGGAVSTPHVDALAARGQVFEDAVASFHQTSMSMGGLFTGREPSLESGDPARPLPWRRGSRCGMARLQRQGDRACLPDAADTIAEDLRGAGYTTWAVVANPLLFRPYGFDQGFDRWIEVGDVPGGALRQRSRREHAESRRGERVNEAVRELLRESAGERLFLYVHYLDAHDWLLLRRGYARGVAIQDERLGELFALLESQGLMEGATVVLTSDHGEALGEPHPQAPKPFHLGNPSYESVLRVPLVVAPAFFQRTDGMVRGSDLRGMIRALAGLAPIPPLPEAAAPGDRGLYVSEQHYRTWRGGRYKSMWPRDGGPALLFDLAADPAERKDVAEQHPEVLAGHRRRIDERTRTLAAHGGEVIEADDEGDVERLRALGYVE